MSRLLLALGLALILALAGEPGLAKLKRATKSSTVAQSGEATGADGARINAPGAPFTFANVGKLRRLTKVTITLTVQDGETGPGDEDVDDLTLVLNGIDTGIALNGFPTGQIPTRTISGSPQRAAEILASLKANDGAVNATIRDADDPGDNSVGIPAAEDTTLVLEGKQRKKR